ncbi:thiamine pyrophosphate-binding protein [Saccharopolyspora erythraea]|uniref:thiamine pyrophosphate-binding protein n=1 Tax=Saccharopolyspora erythraea TaxID=1836 RepID=UPI001BAA2004|nr:thiamine pyrophosphate-binding protein [Saccharopolyspora erythraea]QUH02166.1 thiamine pyrophosphate-binding protein [Saccharopolyspora erythraea]
MSTRPGRVAIHEQFATDGFEYMFGNPGTVEQGFLDVAGSSELEYVLGLHESVSVGMADGYARASGGPALVQLHSSVGLGNAVGMLYQARRGGAPLVVVVGDAGVRYDAMDAQMAADLVSIAQPVTKYATRVTDESSVLRVLRRATKIAMTPPCGPVVVVLPADVLDEPNHEPVRPSPVPSTRVTPAPATVADMASRLLAGQRRLVLMGDGVAASGAQRELTAVAERLNAPVWGVNSSEVNFDTTHRLYGGELGHMFGTDSERVVRNADSVLIVGTYVFPEVFPLLDGPFREDAHIVHVDLDRYEIAKNHPVDLGVAADPKLTLAALDAELTRQRPVGPGPDHFPEGAEPSRTEVTDAPESLLGSFSRELAERAPSDLVVFDEALTASPQVLRHLPPREPGRFFQTRGGSLGVGAPGAMGIKLARPDAPVVAFTGDGAGMYTIQALWTAARYGIDVTIVVCNNGRYRLLDRNIEQYWSAQGIAPHDYPDAFDLTRPEIGFGELAAGLGVASRRVTEPGEVEPAVTAALSGDGPLLIDLAVE